MLLAYFNEKIYVIYIYATESSEEEVRQYVWWNMWKDNDQKLFKAEHDFKPHIKMHYKSQEFKQKRKKYPGTS